MEAPICVAKGVDQLALKIREIGREHSVPIVENPPLARALHATVEVDQPITPEHYKAVAEVIGYVMKLRGAGTAALTSSLATDARRGHAKAAIKTNKSRAAGRLRAL